MEGENNTINLLRTILILVVLILGCKSSRTSNSNDKSLVNENYLDSLVSVWEKNNSIYLEDLEKLVTEEKDIMHIKNVKIYSERASKGYGQYEPRRKNFLRFLFTNYDLESKDFIIEENFQGEKVYYVFINENEKKTFQNIVENWSEIRSESITNYETLVEKVKTFERNNSCNSRLSFSLITHFSKDVVDTKLDDRSCQSVM